MGQIEQRQGFVAGRIGIHVLIEPATGMANVEPIARVRSDRLEMRRMGTRVR